MSSSDSGSGDPASSAPNEATLEAVVGDGSRFVVHVSAWPNSAAAHDAPQVLGSYWPPFGVEVNGFAFGDTHPDAAHTFSVDLGSEDSLVRFESDFGLYVSEKLSGFVAVHAALLHVDDAVVIVPGSSGVGKSSLCVAAMDAGWEVWSDEYCLIDTTTGDVSGWPRPIRQRLTGGGVRRIDHRGPVGPGRATHVLAMTYSADVSGVALEPVPPAQSALDLMANTVCAMSRTKETFLATTAVAKTVSGFSGHRGEIAQALPELRELLRQA